MLFAMGLFHHMKSSAVSFSTGKKESSTATEAPREISIDEPATSAKNDDDATQQQKQESTIQSLRPLQLGAYNFVTGNDFGHSYPSLFEEADEMVKLSNLIYTLIELRELARSGKLNEHKASLQILEMPLPMDQALSIIVSEAGILQQVLSDGSHDAAFSALQSLPGLVADNNNTKKSMSQEESKGVIEGLLDMWNNCLPGTLLHNPNTGKKDQEETSEYTVSTLTAVGDEKCYEELVYVVGINPASKRITVAFRGSTTKNDFVTDARMDMVRVPDPRHFANTSERSSSGRTYEDDEIDSNLCIHQGFYEYMFGTDLKKKNKYAEIMDHIQHLFDANPKYRKEYKLYVTGHSLGGALSTLFGFYACASASLPQPVTIVSVASPRVGNMEFARTFTEFESQGKLRHLRVANHKDPVTLGPTVSNKRVLTLATMAFSPLGYLALKLSGNEAGAEETYYHTGMKLKLRREAQEGAQLCELSYSGAPFLLKEKDFRVSEEGDNKDDEVAGKKNSSSRIGASEMPLVSYHYGSAYSERMALAKTELVGITLNQLYKEKTGKC